MKIISKNYDIDNNLLTLDANIYVFHKSTRQKVGVSTQDFALHKDLIGKEGRYKDYELIPDNADNLDNSFNDFRDFEKDNFLNQVKNTYKNNKEKIFAPMFDSFCKALNDKEQANLVTLITARGHEPESILDGLKFLKSKGYFKYLPKVENIYPVSNPKYNASASKPSPMKVKILQDILRSFNPLKKYYFEFSDDDMSTISLVNETFMKLFLDGVDYSNVMIKLIFTGNNRIQEITFKT